MNLFGIEISRKSRIDDLLERVTLAERELEDMGWMNLNNQSSDSHADAKESFDKMVKRSRLAFIKNPVVKQAINLTTNYTFGQGIQEPKAAEGNEEVQSIITKFWNHPDNRISFTKPTAQAKLSNKLQYDGELAIVLQVDVDGQVYVRLIDPISIVTIRHDVTDSMRPLFYERNIGAGRKQYIPDWHNGLAYLRNNASYQAQWFEMLNRHKIQDVDVPMNTFIYHVKINNDILDKRGIPEVYCTLDWMNANSKISGDMASFINTQAQYAWKKKIKGSKAQVQRFRNRFAQNQDLTNPSRLAGSTIMENDLVSNEDIKLSPGSGQLFEIGERRTLLKVCAGLGIMEHYFGDPSTGNLATSKSMELPMLKKFEAKQKLWEAIYAEVVDYALDMNLFTTSDKFFEYNEKTNRLSVIDGRDYVDRFFDIDFPPILEKDVQMLSTALSTALKNKMVPIETAQRIFMQALGVNNIDEELQKEFYEAPPVMNPFGMPPAPSDEEDDEDDEDDKKKEARSILPWFMQVSSNLRKFGSNRRRFKEAVRPSDDFKDRRKQAVKLSDKNKETLRRMNGYLRGIAGEYRKFQETVKKNTEVTTRPSGELKAVMVNFDDHLRRFREGMEKQANKYFPIAASIGANYVRSRLNIKERRSTRRIFERDMEDFIDEQIRWNNAYLKDSLTPAIEKKFDDKVRQRTFATQKDLFDEIDDVVGSFETRVGSYAGAFWTVEERAVKFSADGTNQKAVFVGVEDEANCPGCQEAIAGNPWTTEDVPIPGEQDCLGSCRHAIQLQESDDPLEESDIDLLRDSEKEFKAGYKILDDKFKVEEGVEI